MIDNTLESFYKALDFFKTANYFQKVEFMKKHWGDVKYDMQIDFEKEHRIQIIIDKNKRYHFTFEAKNAGYSEISKYLPKYAALIEQGNLDALKTIDSSISDFIVSETKDSDTAST